MLSLLKEKRYVSDEIDLIESKVYRPSKHNNYIKCIFYDIVLHNSEEYVGYCDLRIGMNDELYYFGNIGYNISNNYRGNNYAYKACKILFKIAKNEYNMNKLFITCSSYNIASYKTCLKLNGEFIGNYHVPKNHYLYKKGEIEKNIFKYNL